ncbi:conserved hypothetical protein [Gloeothece citriformis PCC 7424]|uniref:Cytochrome-c oxidase n=1 Tax=Gloeothece citriformis (strain PCC 7424) TaxID=65393 RepID=B7KEW6_GLOC7|nr:hypothetical protein [Gloeothece citriformis]ACK70422.1 conserved hypothetical protein [Gloeothece citriformis PCC 7424]
MIIIEITNVEELIKQQIGSFGARVLHAVADDEAKCEKIMIEELQNQFKQMGVKANMFSIAGVDMLGNGKIEIPVKVRSSTFMS